MSPLAMSNIVRVALIYIKGGTYLDLDLISTRPMALESACSEYVYVRFRDKLMTSFINLKKGNEFLKILLDEMVIHPCFLNKNLTLFSFISHH